MLLLPKLSVSQNDRIGMLKQKVSVMSDSKEKLMYLDEISRAQRNLDSAVKYTNLEAALAKKLSDNEYLAYAHFNMANALSANFNYERANAEYKKAVEACDSVKGKACLGDCYNYYANNLTRINDYNLASEYYNKALHLFFEFRNCKGLLCI